MTAYCVRCRVQKEMQSPTAERLKNGATYLIDNCPDCGAKLFRRVHDD